MTLSELQEAVRKWAAGETLVRAVYLFGSRARGESRPDSDIDLAIVHDVDPAIRRTCDDGAARQLTWMRYKARWTKDLRSLLMHEPDINEVSRNGARMWLSLKKCRICLYRRRSARH